MCVDDDDFVVLMEIMTYGSSGGGEGSGRGGGKGSDDKGELHC